MMKKKNGIDTMNKHKQKYRGQVKTIENRLKDSISRAEAKLMLDGLIYRFDGFARQQQLVNKHMSSKYHWGNKRTAQVLRTLSDIGVIDRSRTESDKWTLFFLVKGFIEKCRDRIIQAGLAIRERINRYHLAILSITRMHKERTGT